MMASRISQQGGLIHQLPSVNPDEFLRGNPNSAELARMVKSLSEYKKFLEQLCEKLAVKVTDYQDQLGLEIRLPEGSFVDLKFDGQDPQELQFSPLQTLIISYEDANQKLSQQITKYQKELRQMEDTLTEVMRDNQEICQLELKNQFYYIFVSESNSFLSKFLEFLQDGDFQSRMEQYDREQKLRILEEENAELLDKFQAMNTDQMSLKKTVEDNKQKYNELREQNKNLESLFKKQTMEFQNLSNQYEQLKIRRQADMDQKALAERNAEEFEESAKSMEKQMNKTKQICQRKEQQLQDALNDKNEELTSLQYEYDQLKETNDETQKTLQELENQLQKLQIEKKNNLEEISKLQYANRDLAKKLEIQKINQFLFSRNNLEQTNKKLQNELEITEKSFQELRFKYDAATQERDELEMTKNTYERDLKETKPNLEAKLNALKDEHEDEIESIKQSYKEQQNKLEDKNNNLEQNQIELINKNTTLEGQNKNLKEQIDSLQNNVLETYIDRIKMLERKNDENQYKFQQEFEKKRDLSEETTRHYKERNQQLEDINETYRQNLDSLLTEKNLISKKLDRALEDKKNMLATFEKIKFKVKDKLGNNNDIFM